MSDDRDATTPEDRALPADDAARRSERLDTTAIAIGERPEREYAYGGFHVSVTPIDESDQRWRVQQDDRYFGQIALSPPVRGTDGAHYSAYFPGEEQIPATLVVASWRDAIDFLLDAKDTAPLSGAH